MLLQQLRYFVAVAETGSLSAAANKLFVTQPNLSKSIANLEDEYKTKLFKRTARGMVLTAEGNVLYENAKNILNEVYTLDVALGRIKPNKRKTLTVASNYILGVDFATGSYYKGLDVDAEKVSVEIMNMSTQAVLENVYSGKSMLGFISFQQHLLHTFTKAIKNNNLEYTPLGLTDLYAYVGPTSPLYELDRVKMEQICKYPIVCNIKMKTRREEYIDNVSGYKDCEQFFYLNSDTAIIHFLATTDVTFVGGSWTLLGIEEYGIRMIPISDCDLKYELGWIKSKDIELSKDAFKLIEIVDKQCRPKELKATF